MKPKPKPKPKPKRSTGAAWLATAATIYVGTAGGGIGTATYLDMARSPAAVYATAPPQQRPDVVYFPPEALDPTPMGGAPLQPCPSDAIPKPVVNELRGSIGTVVTGELNVRATPGGRIVGQLFRGDPVEILERRVNGGGIEWVRTKSGWISARFVDTGSQPVDLAPVTLPPPPCPFPQALCLPGTTSMFNQ